MDRHVDLTFVCQSDDLQALECISELEKEKYTTVVLKNGDYAPVGSIAFYTGHNDKWPSRNFRVAAQHLTVNRPSWTITTPFVIAIQPGAKGQMLKAAIEVAHMYIRWYKGETGAELPWETRNGRPSTYTGLVEEWEDLVATAIGDPELQKILASQKLDKNKNAGRGGDIVFRVLKETNKIVLKPEDLGAGLPPNRAYTQLTGVSAAPVSYGTSDVANLFELLEAIKLGYVLGMPVVFETYPSAHDVATWLKGFLNPSLKILGAHVWSPDISDDDDARFNVVITAEKMKRIIKSGKLEKIADILMSWADQPMWVIYQNAMRHAAQTLLNALGVSVDFRFTTTEDICKATGLWDMPLCELAELLKRLADHDVVVFNKPNGEQVKTNMPMPNLTVGQMHERGGWLGGAALYYMVYHLAEFGGVVVMVKDSTRGRVNLMAKPFLNGDSPLRLAPVGLYRLSAEEQNEDWSIDPIVMMQIMANWTEEQLAENAYRIWENMEVPLMEDHIGYKTTVRVKVNGVKVSVQSNT